MKSIELTQEHKDKFLEMCKALFPEYSDWKYGSYKINSTDRLFFADKKQSYDFHWFEFCMTHLLLK
jgi:hypothetical protein